MISLITPLAILIPIMMLSGCPSSAPTSHKHIQNTPDGIREGSDFLSALEITEIRKKGVVKFTAKRPEGPSSVGTGFVVRLESNAAYIVTAAHVVAGHAQPKVEFFTKRNVPVTAEVLGLEGNEVRGLALLMVRGSENLLKGISALTLASTARLKGGEDIVVIGFPSNAGPWAIVKGNISSRQGRDIFFSAPVDSGHSGGPIFQGEEVVGIVGSGSQSVGRCVTVASAYDYIEGFGITAQGSMSIPPPPSTLIESRQLTRIPQGPEIITDRDGAPMLLVPAGEFMMGSREDDKSAGNDERPDHRVYLDAYYIDQYEVTTARYATFFQQTNRAAPVGWSEKILKQHGRKPVVGVNWKDASAYCAWAGKRLPTEAEWEKAARGIDQRLFPWADAAPNEQRANFSRGFDFKDYGVLTDVGSFEGGKSPYGAYDMAGNAWEWTVDEYDENYYVNSPDRNPKGASISIFRKRVVRGGSWGDGPDALRSANRGTRRVSQLQSSDSSFIVTAAVRPGVTPPGSDIGIRCAREALK